MEKILTISIAAYNVEQYIEQALDSLIDERIIDDLEIFVVDDGGKDKTLEIAKRYAEKYPLSVFPIHKENGGYGSTINTSVKLATGKYFKQLDGDDWFEKDNMYRFVELLKTIDVDMVVTQATAIYENNNTKELWELYDYLSEGEYVLDDIKTKKPFNLYSSTFKTSILKDNNIKITEHCFYTDTEYASFPIPYVNKLYICHFTLYQYRIGREGQSMSVEGIKKHFKEHQKVIFNLVDMLNNLDGCSENKREIIQHRLKIEICRQFKNLCYLPLSKSSHNEINNYKEKLQHSCPNILDMVVKEKIYVKLLVYSNGILYPLMRFVTILYLKGLLKPVLKLRRLLKQAE